MVELKRTVVAVLCMVCLLGGATVFAGTASAVAGSGGSYASDAAIIREAPCVARCTTVDSAQPGSLLRLRGSRMREVGQIVFLGASGPADDVKVAALRARVKSVDVVVPDRALSGPLAAINRDGAPSQISRATVSIVRAATSGPVLDVRVIGRRVFYAAERQARVDLLARQPLTVAVALVRLADGAVVQGWPLALVPGVVQSVNWDGTIAGMPQPVGRYEFRVFSQPGGAQAAQIGTPIATGSFDFVDHKFPIRGKHNYGEGMAAFGAGRDGHSHQGHDVFATCGTTLVAARGGVVKLNQHEGRAGNYLVIDGEGTDVDYAYMHMRKRSPLKKGTLVRTGEVIGEVGDTGVASGCHLHFELWSGPGWYTGGSAIDPLPMLKLWDLYS